MELGSHSCKDCLAAELFLSSFFSDTVFVSLLRTYVKNSSSDVHKLVASRWRAPLLLSIVVPGGGCMMVSSVFAGRTPWTSYSSLPGPPFPRP